MYSPKVLCGFILAIVMVINANADPVPEPAKVLHRSAYFNEPANPRFRSVALDLEEPEFRQVDDIVNAGANEDEAVPEKGDASSGRLFMKKFLLFKNMFGANNQQPVIPIIITGAGTGTASPTTTITSTGSIPTATGTITTQPIVDQRSEVEENDNGEVGGVDVQALQAALAANAAEYVVTDQEIKGTSDSKTTKQQESINLRRNGAKKGQYVTVRIPTKYRRYFKNGQKVMLNTNKRVGNKRVVKRRNNKNRRRVNRNRQRSGSAA